MVEIEILSRLIKLPAKSVLDLRRPAQGSDGEVVVEETKVVGGRRRYRDMSWWPVRTRVVI
jgi:hypothetical protein